jgi:transketolase
MPDRPHPRIHPGAIATTTPTSQAGLDAVAELAAQLGVDSIRAFASTFAAFLTRAHDFMRMGAISGVDLRLVGSHAGVEIGADSPSQMGLEALAMLRAVHGSTVLYPSDAANTAALVEAMASTRA